MPDDETLPTNLQDALATHQEAWEREVVEIVLDQHCRANDLLPELPEVARALRKLADQLDGSTVPDDVLTAVVRAALSYIEDPEERDVLVRALDPRVAALL